MSKEEINETKQSDSTDSDSTNVNRQLDDENHFVNNSSSAPVEVSFTTHETKPSEISSQSQIANDELHLTQKTSQQDAQSASDVKFFVGGFHSDVTKENLKSYFSKFGLVTDVKIMRNPVTGQCRGFGFVTMADSSSRSKIMEEREHMICGRRASVRLYTEADMKESFTDGPILKRKIFVGGINPVLGHEVLEAYFEKYGPLEDATIMRYPDGRSRGFGFVVFRDEASCQQALQQRNHFVTLRDRVEVKACLSRGRSRHLGNVMPEPYYRYAGGAGGYGCMNQYPPGAGACYSYNGSPGYYNPVPPSSMYGHYGRTAAYDTYGGSHTGNTWNAFNDYREWWGPYDSYGTYYGGPGASTWHGGNYGSGMLPGGHAPAANSNTAGSTASRPYSHMMSSNNGNVISSIQPSGSGSSTQLAGATPSGHHTYAPLRRGGIVPPTVPYSMPRGRGNTY